MKKIISNNAKQYRKKNEKFEKKINIKESKKKEITK